MNTLEWTDVLLPLLSLAQRMESEGQYNLAKLARAAVDSLGRRAAYQNNQTADQPGLTDQIVEVIESLSRLEIEAGLLDAFRRGNRALSESRLPLIEDTPHPSVCRTCGLVVLGEVKEKCPICGAWPDTFQWFAPIYWLEALDPPVALETLRQTPLAVATLLDGLPEAVMVQEPSDGGWAIRNIVTHLRDAQGVLEHRLELFAKEDHPDLESKAVWTWAKDEAQRPSSTGEIFDEYRATRVKIIAGLENLPLADWWRTGKHKEFGVVSIKQQVSYFAAHERTHLPQIERLRRQLTL